MKLIKHAIKEYYGKRCPDFEPECVVCQAWVEYDMAKHMLNLSKRKRLMRKWVDEDYPTLTEQQRANLTKLFMEV